MLTARVVYIRDTCTHLCNTNPGVKKKNSDEKQRNKNSRSENISLIAGVTTGSHQSFQFPQ